jgi:membrane associated rhomboid family serine protease
MFIPIRTDSPLRSTPWANWFLIAANVICYVIQVNTPSHLLAFHLNAADPHLLNFITYAFLHGSILHLVGNMIFLYAFGNNVNDRMGQLGYMGFYLAGAVAAGIAFCLTDNSPMIGASGAVAAVTGAYLVLLPRSNITIVYFLIVIGAAEIPSLYFVIGFFLLELIQTAYPQLSGGAVAHSAHVGGTLFGFAICMLLLWVHLLPRDQFDILALLGRWNKRRQYQELVRRGYNPFGYSPPPPRGVVNPNLDRIQDLRASIAEAAAHRDLPGAARLYVELLAIDPEQVLSRQMQLDVANQLYAEQRYAPAADGYELFVKYYPKADNIEHIHLMLGMLYNGYLNRPEKAVTHLQAALQRLHNAREVELARRELAHAEASLDAGKL